MRLLRKKLPSNPNKEFVFCSLQDLNEIVRKTKEESFDEEKLKDYFVDMVKNPLGGKFKMHKSENTLQEA